MPFLFDLAKACGSCLAVYYLMKLAEGTGGLGMVLGFVCLMFGSVLVFMAPYMNLILSATRRGAIERPSTAPGAVWRFLGGLLLAIGSVTVAARWLM
ncbi:MAG: hypothetical protein AAGA11_18710 [Pseudomonadota bacterium]